MNGMGFRKLASCGALVSCPVLGWGVYTLVLASWGGEAADLGAAVLTERAYALPSAWINKLLFSTKGPRCWLQSSTAQRNGYVGHGAFISAALLKGHG